jgi:serine/threonine protein kinase
MIQTDVHEDYKFGAVIGSGTFGSVYKALKRSTSKLYAVKVIQKKKIESDPELLEFLKREIEALRKVNHRFLI